MIRLLIIALLMVSLASIACVAVYKKEVIRPLIENEVVFEIKSGDSLTRVADRLIEKKILKVPYWFKITAVLGGYSNQLKAGEYIAQPGITLHELIELIVSGAVQQYSLLLVEGWNYRQTLHAVCNNPAITQTICSRKKLDVTEIFKFTGTHPEGRFFPDTYYLTKGTTDIAFLKRAARRMDSILENEWRNRSKGLPIKTPYEALILASIIEKETGRGDERQEISGVFIRRLKKGMLLQTDPTVIYGMGARYKGNIRSRDLVEDTPYNTYVHAGLPPTPIAMPGIASIQATLHPQDGKSLYFVARGDGSHYFSATLAEHNRAVNKYQRKQGH